MSKKIFIIAALFLLTLHIFAKDYNASLFDIKSDGITSNTESIQYAIDYISENGGGRLVFYVGRYLTGSFYLKPNVTIHLNEGAILVAVQSIYDYFKVNNTQALILGDRIENTGITGKGVIEGHSTGLLKSITDQVQKGYLNETALQSKPVLIHLSGCTNITLDGIILRDACGDVQVYEDCKNLSINNITVQSKSMPDSKGMVISNCNSVTLSKSFFDTAGEELSSNKTSVNVGVKETINAKGKKLEATR